MKSFTQKTFQIFAVLSIMAVLFFVCSALFAKLNETTKTAFADECPNGLDVMLVVDRSDSMTFDTSATTPISLAQPLSSVQSGTVAFLDRLSTTTDKVGLVEFGTNAVTSVPLPSGLANNFDEVRTKINLDWVSGWTNTSDAIDRARTELNGPNARHNARKVIVLLSDGRPELFGEDPVLAIARATSSAAQAKQDGILIYVIGLGNSADESVLQQISSGSAYYHFAPTSADITNAYNAINLPSVCEPPKEPATIIATSLVCQNESLLPNWSGDTSKTITATTATDYVASHPGCSLSSGWKFQYGDQSVSDPGGTFLGEVFGNTFGIWTTFSSPTGLDGKTSTTVSVEGKTEIRVREALQTGFVPFSYPGNNSATSSEMYCSDDVENYDNFDFIIHPLAGQTYWCVAFNAKVTAPPVNQKPVITLVQDMLTIFVGNVFNPLVGHATANDPEEGNITSSITASSDVNTGAAGFYHVIYNVKDSQNLAADPKTLTVEVKNIPPASQPPTLMFDVSSNSITVGQSVTLSWWGISNAASCTASGAWSGNKSIGGGSETISPSVGTYVYGLVCTGPGGSTGLQQKTVAVSALTTGCTSNCGGGEQTRTLIISNEKVVYQGDGKAIVTWTTNIPASSVVSYGTSSVAVAGQAPMFGYPLKTPEDMTMVIEHSITISGLKDGTQYWFRPISFDYSAGITVGKELTYIVSPTPATPIKPIVEPVACNYLQGYIKLGANNDPDEVKKLERFLNTYENENLAVNGIYEQADYDAVGRFQKKYSGDVLNPWGYNESTGYVYITTKKKINEIFCAQPFPLSTAQEAEIVAFKAFLKQLAEHPPVPVTNGTVPTIENATDTATSSVDFNNLVGLLDDAKGTNTETPLSPQANKSLAAAFMGGMSGALTSYWYISLLVILICIAIVLFIQTRKNKQD